MYQKVFQTGKVLRGKPITLRYCRIDADHTRVGFIIRKKVGNACMRNSIRRTLRVSFQAIAPKMPEGTWIIFDVSDKASLLRRAELKIEADQLLLAASNAPAGLAAAVPIGSASKAPASIASAPTTSASFAAGSMAAASTASASNVAGSMGATGADGEETRPAPATIKLHPKKWNGPA